MIGLVSEYNFIRRQALTHAAYHPHSTAPAESKGTSMMFLLKSELLQDICQNDDAYKAPTSDLSSGLTPEAFPVKECFSK